MRENYRRNFLTPTGDPQGRFHPDVRASWVNSKFPHHASEVASVILDLAPHAQVQPVTMFHGLEDCDLATAVTRLCSPEWNHVGVINISAGIIAGRTKRKTEQNPDGTLRELSKIVNAPRVTEAFKAAARAGKIVVLAVDNKGENIQLPEYRPSGSASINCFVGRILNKLKKDPLTRQSVIFAGALDLNTNTIAAYSNRPGNLPEAQDSFLCASGDYEFAYKPEAAAGTSLAAPAITAALLDLLSIPGVTPQRAAKALLETADKGLDTTLYGRGRMNAARAAEWLEAGNY